MNPDPEELRFRFLSGRLSLAFVATLGKRWQRGIERLRDPDDLARWYREAGLLDEPVVVTAEGLEAARTLREAIHRIAWAVMHGADAAESDEEILNAAAAVPPLVPVLHAGISRLTQPGGVGAAAALSTVARDAIDLFADPIAGRIRECADDECSLLFVDTSRPGKRRWCSSNACGGKDRSAAYRRRLRETDLV